MNAPNPRGAPKSRFMQRTGGWAEYTARRNDWIRAHPNASSREIERAARRIAKELGL